jgi:glycosyltransferase involved in cell wall biosynthesis
MKILELTRSFYPSVGGLERFVANRLKIYDELGYQYRIVSTDFSSEKRDDSKARNDVEFLKQYTPYNIAFGLRKVLRDDYDVVSVHLLGRRYSDLAIRLASKRGAKVVLTPHFSFHTPKYATLKRLHERFVAGGTLKRVDRLICFTETEREFWRERFALPSEKIAKIPHFFEPPIAAPSAPPTDKKYLLYVGRIAPNKRLDLAIAAFRETNYDGEFAITGDPRDLPEETRRHFDEDRRLRSLGYVSEEEKAAWLSRAEALVFPSDYEAFGATLFEASAYRRPVLCSSLDVFREIMDPRGAMFFKNETASIRETFERFDNRSAEEKRAMGERNYENLGGFRFERIVEEYRRLFEDLTA